MFEPVNIRAFKGMQNLNPSIGEQGTIPKSIVNAIAIANGTLVKRKGSEKITSDSSYYSDLWKSTTTNNTYCIKDNSLCIVNLKDLIFSPIETITHKEEKVYFVSVNSIDIIGNKYWITAIENSEARTVGQSIIDVQNLNWESTDNGTMLYKKNSDGTRSVIPHPAEFAHAPSPLDFIVLAHGRLWGASGNKVFYSLPNTIEWFEYNKKFFEFDTDVTMIAPNVSGIFIGTNEITVFLEGTNPDKMRQSIKKFDGVVKHSLLYNREEIPIWMDTEGFVIAGSPDGQVLELTKDKVGTKPSSQCRAGVVKINKVDTLLFRIKELNHG